MDDTTSVSCNCCFQFVCWEMKMFLKNNPSDDFLVRPMGRHSKVAWTPFMRSANARTLNAAATSHPLTARHHVVWCRRQLSHAPPQTPQFNLLVTTARVTLLQQQLTTSFSLDSNPSTASSSHEILAAQPPSVSFCAALVGTHTLASETVAALKSAAWSVPKQPRRTM